MQLAQALFRRFRHWNLARLSRHRKRRRLDYEEWCARHDTLAPPLLDVLGARAKELSRHASVDLLWMEAARPGELEDCLRSLRGQLFRTWRLHVPLSPQGDAEQARWWQEQSQADPRIVCHEVSAEPALRLRALLRAATAPWCGFVSERERLRPHALLKLVEGALQRADAVLVYGDEDRIDSSGRRHSPWFKGDFDPESLLGHDAIGRPSLFHSETLRKCVSADSLAFGALLHDLALRVTERIAPERVVHVPHVLCHRLQATPQDLADTERAVAAHLARLGIAARAEAQLDHHWPVVRVRFALPEPAPWATVIVPTRNNLNALRACVTSILERTTYPNYDVAIIDNACDDPECLRFLEEVAKSPRVQVRRDPRLFNFASLNNASVRAARGEFVALLNDDVEVLSPDWLQEMLSLAARPGVGAVGARLLYADRTLQHGGVIVGLQGAAGHAMKRLSATEAGPGGRARLMQSYLAVTAACLVVSRASYEQVGGMNEAEFAVAYNDVDFCLKLHAAGYRNLWTPHAELLHHESVSRKKTDPLTRKRGLDAESRALCARWPQWVERDPYYNPNLTLASDDFGLADPPRVSLTISATLPKPR
ncbi:MAG TPA: glycosyltransferase family 2 protein [Polyangiaceae bacterium]|nr:glycosyltransferase family 2 protein [Polyangiaceae bacterium]